MFAPEISVIIAAYNCGPWIAECITSVLQQSFSDLEVIVVDDGSTDNTAETVAAFDDHRLRYCRRQNSGQSVASNVGAELASGRYLKFVDADDVLNSEHLAAQYESIRNFSGAISACSWGYFREYAEQTIARVEHVGRDYDDPLEWIVTSLTRDEGMMGAWMWLIPREVWEQSGGFNPELTLNKDFELSIRLLLGSQSVKFASAALYCYRKGTAAAVTQNRGPKALASAVLTTELAMQWLLAREDSARIRRICADRFQMWLFSLYPENPMLVERVEEHIRALGGSQLPFKGGALQRILTPLLGWHLVRRLQVFASKWGWKRVQRWKQWRRLKMVK